jgi:TonB family protein
VGLVEGRWLRPNPMAMASKQVSNGMGAAVPIHYAIALLQQQGVVWHEAQGDLEKTAATHEPTKGSSAPIPLSLVPAPYPSEALSGGEVVLDALVDQNGRLVDIKVVRGGAPFLAKVLSAVQTWSFLPVRANGEIVKTRIGIAFQFAQPALSAASRPTHTYNEPLASAEDRSAVPIVTTEPQSQAKSDEEGSVILSAEIDAQGQLSTLQVLRDAGSLGPTIESAVRKWQFAPGRLAGANCNSTIIVVVMPRHGTMPNGTQSTGHAHSLEQ